MKDNDELPIITCRCGEIILPDNISYTNGCNENGEEYGEVGAFCDVCNKYYETYQWGEWESRWEAIECFSEYMDNHNNLH